MNDAEKDKARAEFNKSYFEIFGRYPEQEAKWEDLPTYIKEFIPKKKYYDVLRERAKIALRYGGQEINE